MRTGPASALSCAADRECRHLAAAGHDAVAMAWSVAQVGMGTAPLDDTASLGWCIHTVRTLHAVDSRESTGQQPGMTTGLHYPHIKQHWGSWSVSLHCAIPCHGRQVLAAQLPRAALTPPTDHNLGAGRRPVRPNQHADSTTMTALLNRCIC